MKIAASDSNRILAVKRRDHLGIASLHVSQRHFRINGMTAGHAENLEICVVALTFVHLQKSRSFVIVLLFQKYVAKEKKTGENLGRHLLVLLNRLLLGLGDDALQLVEAPLHVGEAEPGVLLVPADALQLLLAVLLGDAGTLLPLLDPLREDLVDPAAGQGWGGRSLNYSNYGERS